MLSLLLALSTAHAQDCDVRELQKAYTAATPAGMPNAYSALAACDAKKAASLASDAFSRALPGAEGNQVVLTAIQVGANAEARASIGGLQADERSRTVAALGGACDQAGVPAFLTETATELGDAFWADRWYRSLTSCRDPGVQGLLATEMANPSDDRTRFFGVLEVYSRNLGSAAVPTLEGLLATVESEEELTYVVNAFADAAQVGSAEGQDPEATKLAVAAIVKAAPALPTRAVEQARTTLISLGAEGEADQLAGVRWAAAAHADGNFHYGVMVVETVDCKGKVTRIFHTGEGVEGGDTWPDQVAAGIEGIANSGWAYEASAKGKCTGSNEVLFTPTPLSAEEIKAWTDEQIKEASKVPAKKTIVQPEEAPLAL